MLDQPSEVPAADGTFRRNVLWGVLAVIVIAVVGILWWASIDRALILEEELTVALDATFDRADDSWCEEGCSPAGHEWHSQGGLTDVAGLVADRARSINAEATLEPGDSGTILVNIERGKVAVTVAVTDGTWAQAAPGAAGTAVWFTSVTAFDVP